MTKSELWSRRSPDSLHQSSSRYASAGFSVLSNLLLVLATGVSLCLPAKAADTDIAIILDEREVRVAGITTVKADKERREVELSLPGTVVIPPQQLRVVAAPASGLVELMLLASDEPVKEGEAVARLRSTEVVEAQRQFLAALADEGLAADRLRRIELLVEARATPERELRVAQTSAINARSHLDERRQILSLMELSHAEIELLQTTRKILPAVTVHAPAGGTIVKRHVSPGERVDAAAPLYTIAKLDPLWVNIQVPASRLAALAVGNVVELPAHGVKGRIIRIARTVESSTQSASAVAEIDANGGAVRPGLATSVTIRLNQGPEAQWSVPSAAVVRHRDRSWIFIRTKDGFVARTVQVISESLSRTSVRAELGPEDQIADRGVIALLSELALADKS